MRHRSLGFPEQGVGLMGLRVCVPLRGPLRVPLGIRRSKVKDSGWEDLGLKDFGVLEVSGFRGLGFMG